MIRLLLTLALAATAFAVVAETRGGVRLPAADGAPAQELYEKSFALVIGNDAYSGGWPRLSNAVRDATAVAEDLDRRGFEVTLKTDLDSQALEEAIEDFIYGPGQQARSRLLIWYAGHGHMIGDEAYLVPVDAPAADQEGRFRRGALSLRDFGKYMREVRSLHVLAIFDSCFSGTVFETARALPSPAITRATGLPVRQMISSGDSGQTVSDDGTFRRLFLAALSGEEPYADANRDGYLTGSELGLFLADKVTSLTLNRQTPRYGKLRELGFDRGDFVFEIAPPVAAIEVDVVPTGPVARHDTADILVTVSPGGALVTFSDSDARVYSSFDMTSEGADPIAYRRARKDPDTVYRLEIEPGATIRQVIDALSAMGLLDREAFVSPREASLWPGIYDIRSGTDWTEFFEGNPNTPLAWLALTWEARAPDLPLSVPEDALILASMIQAETSVPEEMGRVASVYVNRLREGMPLQSDAPLVYEVSGGYPKLSRGLRKSELLGDSRYNTYGHKGLPPGPISIPSSDAIAAALHPEQTDARFFVRMPGGELAFSAGLAEHNGNVAKARAAAQK